MYKRYPYRFPPLAYTADECLKGLIQREFKIRLLIFITWLQTAGVRERERLTKAIKTERGEVAQRDESSIGGSQCAPSPLEWARLSACRAVINNGKLFNASNELFVTADTAGLEGEKIRRKKTERCRGGRNRHRMWKAQVNSLKDLGENEISWFKCCCKHECNSTVWSGYSKLH